MDISEGETVVIKENSRTFVPEGEGTVKRILGKSLLEVKIRGVVQTIPRSIVEKKTESVS